MNKLISNNKNFLAIVILISGIGAGILSYLQYKNNIIPTPSVSPSISNSPVVFTSPTPTPAITPPPEIWETYTNSQLGFSIKYPQMVYGIYRCEPDKPFYVPVKVFEDNKNGIVYIAEEFYYDNWDDKAQSNTGPCRKIIYSIDSLTKAREIYGNPFLSRVFSIKNIKNNTELNKYIKNSYGSGCFIEKKVPWKSQDGVYEISIKGEDWDKGADPETTTCRLPMSRLIFLYEPVKGKFMSVNMGQECGFTTDYNTESFKCYDDEMINSFRFE